jgi:hypothetical protein
VADVMESDLIRFGAVQKPRDAAEREAVRNFQSGVWCKAEAQGWVCTRSPGHEGAHIAANSEYICVSWQHERILCAAIWVDTGKAEPPRRTYTYPKTGLLFTGWRHCDCFVTLDAWADLLPSGERKRIGEEQIAGLHQGFLTSRGRFVDRKEAMTIARAAGQTNKTKVSLTSEDIY